MLDDKDLASLRELIDFLASTPPMPIEEAMRRQRLKRDIHLERVADWLVRSENGENVEEPSYDESKKEAENILSDLASPASHTQYNPAIWRAIPSHLTKDDLFFQCEVAKYIMNEWYYRGEYPPYGEISRILVILRKSKRFDLEREFLSAYRRHFAGHATIDARANKLGIPSPEM